MAGSILLQEPSSGSPSAEGLALALGQ